MVDSDQVYSNTASAAAALTGPVLIHKVQVEDDDAGPTAYTKVALYDALTATGTAVAVVSTSIMYTGLYTRVASEAYDPPIAMENGVSTTLTITGAGSYRIYYSRR